MIDRIRAAYRTACTALLAERTPAGHWVGELSASALSTATAVGALALVDNQKHGEWIRGGLRWLAANANADGGWGDTVRSHANISTTMLVRAAVHLAGAQREYAPMLAAADAWLAERYGSTPAHHAEAVRQRYGRDRTFSVPILTMSALAGLVAWNEVPALPFEWACVPQAWYRFVRLPVVSYALPALIAIGQAVAHHRPAFDPLTRTIRQLAQRPSLAVLQRIQPSNGGFLEATPLTAFVTMSLASIGLGDHAVTEAGVRFLVASVQADGAWPIDTNLATWVTTLAVNAIAADDLSDALALREWLLAQQYRRQHPYTGAAAGAWAWTPLPGGVPDADDTPGALLALRRLPMSLASERAARRGCRWLADLQNTDGGIPTFCRGWTGLPFDRSGSDLTAHTLRAWHAWGARVPTARARALAYLERTQRADGAWLPLWFGNQHAPDETNPTYGTAKVLAAYRDLGLTGSDPARRGVAYLLGSTNTDGGWGGAADTPSSIEETALAVEALAGICPQETVVSRGLAWLCDRVESDRWREATPIGFYFAKLWYFERLYPLTMTVAALGRAR